MLNDQVLSQFKQALSQAQSILVVLGPQAKFDQAAVATAIYQALLNLPDKEVSLLTPDPIDFPDLQLQHEFKYKIGNKDLSVSFDYDEKSVDKVSYHIDEQAKKFYLVIKPQKGQKPLDHTQVSFDYTGAEADLIILIGVHDLTKLEHLYTNYKNLYESTVIVTINGFEPDLGVVKIDLSGKNCWSELLVTLLKDGGWQVGSEGATNLLTSIYQATQNLSSSTTSAETFEAVAQLMRWGGKRLAANNQAGWQSLGEVMADRKLDDDKPEVDLTTVETTTNDKSLQKGQEISLAVSKNKKTVK